MREQFSHARRKVRADRVNNEKDVRMRKIVFHINSLEQGGAERVITNLAHQFNMIMHMRIIGEISSIMNLQRHRPLFIKKFHKVPFPPTFLP